MVPHTYLVRPSGTQRDYFYAPYYQMLPCCFLLSFTFLVQCSTHRPVQYSSSIGLLLIEAVSYFLRTSFKINQMSESRQNSATWALWNILFPDMHCDPSIPYFRFLQQKTDFCSVIGTKQAGKALR